MKQSLQLEIEIAVLFLLKEGILVLFHDSIHSIFITSAKLNTVAIEQNVVPYPRVVDFLP